ncbi:GNAT family N-acetyltransferase [Aestuariibius sp. HNIBRBA575]|uniref:GNAT family N-acetyltransferase n=1 Tax=Aestuariibius sp. HNIBRBA575 TaxID=3233343 RepID=UPI0034A1BF25
MTPSDLAAIHAGAFQQTRPWTEQEFADLLAKPSTLLVTSGLSFVLASLIADEAEILTLATDPTVQRQGQARAAMLKFVDQLGVLGVTRIFLEVAANNRPALGHYADSGFQRIGLRRNYYRLEGNQRQDAVVMEKKLTPHHPT